VTGDIPGEVSVARASSVGKESSVGVKRGSERSVVVAGRGVSSGASAEEEGSFSGVHASIQIATNVPMVNAVKLRRSISLIDISNP